MPLYTTAKRRGSIVVLTAVCLVMVVAFLAFAIDLGYIVVTESELQNAADAAAMSGARALPEGSAAAIAAAKTWAAKNVAAGETVEILDSDIEIGVWNEDAKSFTLISPLSTEAPNAVRVTCHRTASRGNALRLFFAPVLGSDSADLTETATAIVSTGGVGSRFLIDDEMIDKDVPAIQQLASKVGRDVEELLTPRGFNEGKQYGDSDWAWPDDFIDLPAGAKLSLPTGQGTSYDNNDAGMFDFNHDDFPFADDESFLEFLMYSETGGDSSKWGTDSDFIRNQLDPLTGASPITDGKLYPSFVDPDFVHVSPVWYSDISTLNKKGDIPQLNAKGLRRGLIAFKIVAVGKDVDGSGSVLPELVIEIVDPTTIDPKDLRAGEGVSGGKVKLVQ